MKNKYFIIIIAGCVTLFAGCKKLTETPYSVISNLKTETDIKAAALGIYQSFYKNGWPGTMQFWNMVENGHKYSTYAQGGDDYFNNNFYRYLVTNKLGDIQSTWQILFTMINRSNEVIEGATANITDVELANSYAAEGRFMRAWANFMGVQFWGEFPLHDKATTSLADEANVFKERAPAATVYASIIEDLEFAAKWLPKKRSTGELGRVTQGSALGMLGKVHLTMAGVKVNDAGGYDKAISTFERLMQQNIDSSYGYQLSASYKEIFSETNEINSEILFAIKAYANSSNQDNGIIFPWLLCSDGMNAQPQQIARMYALRWDIMRLFDKSDIRLRDGVGGYYDDLEAPMVAGKPDTLYFDTLVTFRYKRKGDPSYVAGGGPGGVSGLGFSKWRSYTYFVGYPGGFRKDYNILRWSDVLLCFAEALNEKGRTGEAVDLVNQVRGRAGAVIYSSSDQVAVRQTIRDERRRELVGECTTILDIRRWGTLQEEMAAFRTDQFVPNAVLPVYNQRYELYPVPFAEISTNGKLTQNPGWE